MECSKRLCCIARKCKVVSKTICIEKSKIANGCKFHFLGKGRCRRKFCCHDGKCSFKGKKLCKIIPDKRVYYPKKNLCLFKRYTTKNKSETCTRRMCCNNKRCFYRSKAICYKISKPFCTRSYIRNGKCLSKFCCKLNKNKKYNCKHAGRKTCFFKRKHHLKCRWNYKKK